jgi:DNA-binding CsgD family transcriptional regulator
MPVEDRLILGRKIDFVTGCWEWTKGCDGHGYGRLWDGTRATAAHLASWVVYVGPIPKGKNILHTCDNPPCFNPSHLYAGTQKDNVRDMIERRRGLVGSHNGASILTERQVLSIRELAKTKTGYRIAKELGVNYNTIYDILRGDTWSWL